MQHTHLWRINQLMSDLSAESRAVDMLTLGLQRHLLHADLITMIMQIGSAQRAYVRLAGCDGCRHNQCRMGCRVMLLRRTLGAAGGPHLTLAAVERGLMRRPYTRICLAWPGRQASAPVTAQLHAWPEARLLVHWRPAHAAGAPVRVTALLLVGDAGPDPAVSLRQAGWMAVTLPRPLATPWMGAFPGGLPPGRPWRHAPFLLFPQTMPETSGQMQLPHTPPLNWEQVDILAAICQAVQQGYRLCVDPASAVSGPTATPACLDAQPASQPASPWPHGPGSGRTAMPPDALATLVTQLLSDSGSQVEGDPGLTRRRIAALLPDRYKEHAQALLAWFDRAELLAPARDPAQPWRYGRCLLVHDPAEIAARLMNATLFCTAEDAEERREEMVSSVRRLI